RVVRGPEIFLQHLLVVAGAELIGVLVKVLERVGPERGRLPAMGVVHKERYRRHWMAAVKFLRGDSQEAIDQFALGRQLYLVNPRRGCAAGFPEFVEALLVVKH